MFDRTAVDDEERQIISMGARRNGKDAVQETLFMTQTPPPEASQSDSKKSRATKPETQQPEPMHSCFLCLRGRRQTHYAIRIPCHRSRVMTATRIEKVKKKGQPTTLVPRSKRVRNGYYEDDSQIYEKLVAACYQYHGNWKKWIPFYGIVDVQELEVVVLFMFLSANIDTL